MAPSPERAAAILLSWHGLALTSCTPLQDLWAGYGTICAITARPPSTGLSIPGFATDSSGVYRLILKLITPPPAASTAHPADEGRLRKILSYDAETYFYAHDAPRLGHDVAVARLLDATRHGDERPGARELQGCTAMVMQDLRPLFPVAGGKRLFLAGTAQVGAALDWLARFHRSSRAWYSREDMDEFLRPPLQERRRRPGARVWKNGGYTYLTTRRSEFDQLRQDASSEWCALFCDPRGGGRVCVAEAVAAVLTPRGREMESYIHGDVKSENLFSSEAGDRVAFFDFQYVGLGLGACDLAKLMTCAVPPGLLEKGGRHGLLPMGEGEERLLRRYYAELARGEAWYSWDLFVRHWETALVDWCRFQASWGFWGNSEWLGSRVRWILKSEEWRGWLDEEERILDLDIADD